jgi:hypothetical protein
MAKAIEKGIDMPAGCYFECHVPIHCSEAEIPMIREVAKETGAHVSRNIFKITEDGTQVVMVTLRKRNMTASEFSMALFWMKQQFMYSNLSIEGKELLMNLPDKTEFIVYDDNEAHDNSWLGIK